MSAAQPHTPPDAPASPAHAHAKEQKLTLGFAVISLLTSIALSAFAFWIFVAWCRTFIWLDYLEFFEGARLAAFAVSLVVYHAPVFIFWASPCLPQKLRYFLPLLLSLTCLFIAEDLMSWAWPFQDSPRENIGVQALVLLLMFAYPYALFPSKSRQPRIRRGFLPWLRDPHHQGFFHWLREP